jgi:type II secretory pathway pseudopilin PulG
MIVIEVVIFLLAMLLPALSRARESARRANCLNNLKQIITGIKEYTPDYDDYYPTSAEPNESIVVGTHYRDLGILYPTYVVSLDVFTCPGSRDRMPMDRARERTSLVPNPNKPFTDSEAKQVSYAYSYNGAGRNMPWTQAAPSTTRILADRHASIDLSSLSNHKLDGRNVAFQAGYVRWVSGKGKLYTDPDNPDTKINTQCWWSERPDRAARK